MIGGFLRLLWRLFFLFASPVKQRLSHNVLSTISWLPDTKMLSSIKFLYLLIVPNSSADNLMLLYSFPLRFHLLSDRALTEFITYVRSVARTEPRTKFSSMFWKVIIIVEGKD
jgi:hypothetical protein